MPNRKRTETTGIHFIDEPPELEIIDGAAHMWMRSGGETIHVCCSVFHLLAGMEAGKRAYDEWRRKGGNVLPMAR